MSTDFPEIQSFHDFTFSPEMFVTGWNRTLQRNVDFEIVSPSLGLSQGVKVFSLPVKSRFAFSSRSYYFELPPCETVPQRKTRQHDRSGIGSGGSSDAEFTEHRDLRLFDPDEQHSGEQQSDERRPAFFKTRSQLTRFRIPPDAIKIEDRLGYILQPPLESILSQPTLEMPFEPFPYQREGIAFLYSAHFGILADEMGLGKTMQAITTVRLLLRTGEVKNVLFVCPKPLVSNWRREFELWAPEISVQVIEGGQQRRKWCWQLPNVPVRIANYELLHRDMEYFQSPHTSGGVVFDLVVLDESQRIKNRSSATAHAARTIPRKRSWALTGTPVENDEGDLVGIFEFLSPGFLESGLKPEQIGRVVGDHILRRTKENVLTDLPPKLVRDSYIELTSSQRESYRLAKDSGVQRLKHMEEENEITIQNVFELILRLKQICNFDPVTGESAKLERLYADLEEVAQSGQKAIIFSQWVETLQHLKVRLRKFHPVEYHGKIPSKQRDGVIERFREDGKCSIILMSYGAGSVGLNLQFAGYVFLFDRWWNPAVEDQAINRAHRIGAAGPVTVSRFLAMRTIEDDIDNILRRKRELSEKILSGARGLNHSSGMNQDEIFGLFDLKPRSVKKVA